MLTLSIEKLGALFWMVATKWKGSYKLSSQSHPGMAELPGNAVTCSALEKT